ncbi:hypothetical protein VHEMI09253 [[Torrubiella] hemipterigena]|uniref:NACHT-NTPase and P-loop NTPases N-terminal domain-containing protein n=1 Tax=[Torrubiella] hemipterigena TaxID=1531966 RepID=A0A0A1TFZ9_9HYPO|nr:hypothetical protein VHEMI09253 [[Torrubiella] hemipterigena]
MSGAEVLGIISTVISIIDTTIQLSITIKDEASLPSNFKTVAAKLPLIAKLLDNTERYVEEEANNDLASTFLAILRDCEEKATKLQVLFEKVVPANGDSRVDRYIKAARTIGNGGRVETLMKAILDGLQLLMTTFPRVTSRRGLENLTKAIE